MHGENNPNYKHGMRGTRFYKIWAGMKKRCDNPDAVNYKNYGGRGITYDPKWSIFENFKVDMFSTYEDSLTLERINNSGNYCKANCEWVSKARQSRNQRKRTDNNSGVVGVCRNTNFNKKVNKEYPSWTATWKSEDGRARAKNFSVNKYGEDLAFRLACEYRASVIKSLLEQGIFYSYEHGK